MCKSNRKFWRLICPLIFQILLFIPNTVYPQIQSDKETILNISRQPFSHIRDNISLFSEDTLHRDLSSLIPPRILKDRTLLFLDSLKARSSKFLFTRKLYDLIIVSNEPANKKQITTTSDISFLNHSGKKIRKIYIQRLNIFGADIDNPVNNSPNLTENLLNKTHINTNEFIVRKNLLFSEGDKISPLIFSDNERILRRLSFIDDARIIVVPVSDEEADIIVITKDVYSLGAGFSYKGLKKGSVSLFEKNIFGTGQELGFEVPYDAKASDSPGFGIHYTMDNIGKTFINFNLNYFNDIGKNSYGFRLTRDLISATTKYAGGISVLQVSTSEDLDTLPIPESLKYNIQDYWLSRSFLIDKESVTRIIIGARYTNNNVFDRPFILPYSYLNLQKYRMFLGTAAFSIQKYYKTNLIYNYGRTEDIPYGGLLRFTVGKEINEFKNRTYFGADISLGKSSRDLGYFYGSAGLSSYFAGKKSEQGLLLLEMKYFSNLVRVRNFMIRNFVNIKYTRGFARYTDERLTFSHENGFSGFTNDTVSGTQRVICSLESVIFSPLNFYGFRFAFFGFADISFIAETNQLMSNGNTLSAIGLGMRIRNDNLVINTLQFRLGFYPNFPLYSSVNHFVVSGEQLLKPKTFDPGPPSIIPYR